VALATNESKVTAMRVWFVVSSLIVFSFAMTKGLFGRVENERIGGKWMKVVAEWNFDKAGDLQGWQPNAQITDMQKWRTEFYPSEPSATTQSFSFVPLLKSLLPLGMSLKFA
jgi:hypothetical protein